MEEERTHKEIELRSEEVQEVMGRIPNTMSIMRSIIGGIV